MVVDPSEGDRQEAVIYLTLITSNPRLTSPSDKSSAGVLCDRFFGFWVEGVIGQVMVVEVGFDGLEIRHASHDDSCSVSCATNSKFCLTTIFSPFSN
jgi:hypothetical protein